MSSKRLEQLEKENKSLEQETSQLEKDKNNWRRKIRDSATSRNKRYHIRRK